MTEHDLIIGVSADTLAELIADRERFRTGLNECAAAATKSAVQWQEEVERVNTRYIALRAAVLGVLEVRDIHAHAGATDGEILAAVEQLIPPLDAAWLDSTPWDGPRLRLSETSIWSVNDRVTWQREGRLVHGTVAGPGPGPDDRSVLVEPDGGLPGESYLVAGDHLAAEGGEQAVPDLGDAPIAHHIVPTGPPAHELIPELHYE